MHKTYFFLKTCSYIYIYIIVDFRCRLRLPEHITIIQSPSCIKICPALFGHLSWAPSHLWAACKQFCCRSATSIPGLIQICQQIPSSANILAPPFWQFLQTFVGSNPISMVRSLRFIWRTPHLHLRATGESFQRGYAWSSYGLLMHGLAFKTTLQVARCHAHYFMFPIYWLYN